MRQLLYYLGIIDLVWTEDRDKDLRLRTVWHRGDERYVGDLLGRPLLLLPEGNIGTDSYVKHWYPYELKPNRARKMTPFSRNRSKAKDVMWRLQGHKISK